MAHGLPSQPRGSVTVSYTHLDVYKRQSLVFSGVRVHSFAKIECAVILPEVDIGRSARLRNVIIEHGVHIPEGLVVGEDPALDAKRFRRTANGICLINQSMICLLYTSRCV